MSNWFEDRLKEAKSETDKWPDWKKQAYENYDQEKKVIIETKSKEVSK